jgi:hypothetical protein
MNQDASEQQMESFVEDLFWKYRNNFDNLRQRFEKKGPIEPSQHKTIKIKGEEFNNGFFVREKIDLSLHSCGLKSYPTDFYSYYDSFIMFDSFVITEEQKRYLDELFDKLEIDFVPYEEAVSASKGLWLEYIHSRDIEIYLKEKPRRKPEEHLNFTGQFGDALGFFISNYRTQIQDLVFLPIFKKITGATNPSERMGFISNYFLRKFVDKNYTCEHYEVSQCVICNSDFYPQSNREWVNRVPPVFCEICLTMGFSASTDFNKHLGFSPEERKSNYVKGTVAYAEYFGFIPPSDYQKRKVIQQLYKSGIPILELTFAIKVSSLLPWSDTAKKLFGSWAHLLEEAGLLTQSQRGRGGHRSIASDGHLCLSMGERAICEFLTKNGITHEREPMYPFDEVFNPNGLLRGDFLIGDLVIEFAGMMSNPDYAERMKTKEKLAKARKIPWLKLETSSLDDLNEMLIKIETKLASLPSGQR